MNWENTIHICSIDNNKTKSDQLVNLFRLYRLEINTHKRVDENSLLKINRVDVFPLLELKIKK